MGCPPWLSVPSFPVRSFPPPGMGSDVDAPRVGGGGWRSWHNARDTGGLFPGRRPNRGTTTSASPGEDVSEGRGEGLPAGRPSARQRRADPAAPGGRSVRCGRRSPAAGRRRRWRGAGVTVASPAGMPAVTQTSTRAISSGASGSPASGIRGLDLGHGGAASSALGLARPERGPTVRPARRGVAWSVRRRRCGRGGPGPRRRSARRTVRPTLRPWCRPRGLRGRPPAEQDGARIRQLAKRTGTAPRGPSPTGSPPARSFSR